MTTLVFQKLFAIPANDAAHLAVLNGFMDTSDGPVLIVPFEPIDRSLTGAPYIIEFLAGDIRDTTVLLDLFLNGPALGTTENNIGHRFASCRMLLTRIEDGVVLVVA